MSENTVKPHIYGHFTKRFLILDLFFAAQRRFEKDKLTANFPRGRICLIVKEL